MKGCKFLVLLLILIDLIFAQTKALDSTKINSLNKQKLFFATGENWIPPSCLPSEPSCYGCCLLPSAGCLIVRETFRKDAKPESLKVIPKPKFSIGISYSPGIAYAGMLPRSLETGELDPFHALYWNNLLEIDAKYYLTLNWALGVGGGYMWTHLGNRCSYLRPPELWHLGNSNEWNIWNFYGAIALCYILPEGLFTSGVEYYNATGMCYEQWLKGDTIRIFTGRVFSKGPGWFISAGFDKSIFSSISWHTHLVLRYGTANSYKQETEQENVVWVKNINFYFTGIYIKIGINYNFLKKGG